MVKFRISLNLHNFKHCSNGKYSKQKMEKIHQFYKLLAQIIKSTHNCDVKRTQKQFKDYSEPLIKIKRNIFSEPSAVDENHMAAFIDTVFPPTIDIDIEFKMTSEREEVALKQFHTYYKGSMNNKSYKELRVLYYSTKIINFVNRLRGLINENIFWMQYINHEELKTKYKPVISVSDAAVLSLN